MIYVTHDQTEALTFADQGGGDARGEVVQIGTPVDLFERPQHTFVGHFIGSPGMNVLPCEVERRRGRGSAAYRCRRAPTRGDTAPAGRQDWSSASGRSSCFAAERRHAGHRRQGQRRGPLPIVERPARATRTRSSCWSRGTCRSPEHVAHLPSIRPTPRSTPTAGSLSGEGWMGGAMNKTNQKAWWLRRPVVCAGRVQRDHPADDGGQLLGPGDLRRQRLLLGRLGLVRAGAATSGSMPRSAASSSSPPSSW